MDGGPIINFERVQSLQLFIHYGTITARAVVVQKYMAQQSGEGFIGQEAVRKEIDIWYE